MYRFSRETTQVEASEEVGIAVMKTVRRNARRRRVGPRNRSQTGRATFGDDALAPPDGVPHEPRDRTRTTPRFVWSGLHEDRARDETDAGWAQGVPEGTTRGAERRPIREVVREKGTDAEDDVIARVRSDHDRCIDKLSVVSERSVS